MKDFLISSKFYVFQIVIIVLLFLQINTQNNTISKCEREDKLTNEICFNKLIHFENFRAGQFAEDEEKNMFILYSISQGNTSQTDRLFYSLKENGRVFFNSGLTKRYSIESSEDAEERKESRIIFVKPEEDSNSTFLFSTSAGKTNETLAELYEIGNNNIINSSANSTLTLWNISEDITSVHYSLMKIPNQNTYFLSFAQNENITIVKFEFNTSDIGGYLELDRITAASDNFNEKVITSFLMENDNILFLFYMKSGQNNNRAVYSMMFYDYDLKLHNEFQLDVRKEPVPRSGLFFKGLYLKENYAAFVYYSGNSYYYAGRFNISELVLNDNQYIFKLKQLKYIGGSEINVDLVPNDFIKINENKLVFLTTKLKRGFKPVRLSFILIDLFDNYTIVKMREYLYDLDTYYIKKELSAFAFRGFLVFTSTYTEGDSDSNNKFNSILAFCGYPNGTDAIINISIFFSNLTNFSENEEHNLFTYLMNNMSLENNIFGYEIVKKINLVFIPPEILFYNFSNNTNYTNTSELIE